MAGLQLVVPHSIQLHATSSSRAPEQLKGRLELFLPEPATISEITVDFVGIVSGRVNGAMASRELCKIGREVSKKKKLAGGLHAFGFAIPVFYNLPCSVQTLTDGPGRGFAIEYQVRAQARVSKPKKAALETRADVVVSSIHTTAGAPFNVPVRVKNSRQDTIKYDVTVPHAAWAAGSTVRSRLSLWVLDPRVKVDSLSCSLVQSVTATVKGGEVRFKQELAKHSGLAPGDNVVELAVPSEILLSYNPGVSERGVKIEHTLDILLKFTDQSSRPSVLQSAVPLTLLDAKQKDDALVAGKQVEDWVLNQVPAATGLVPAVPAGQPYAAPHFFPPVAYQQYPHQYQQYPYPQQQLYPQQPPYVAPNQPIPQAYAPPNLGLQAPCPAPAGVWAAPPAPQADAQGTRPDRPAEVEVGATPAPVAPPAAGMPPDALGVAQSPPIEATSSWQHVPQPPTQLATAMGGSRPTWLDLTYLNTQAPAQPPYQHQQQGGSSTPHSQAQAGKTLPALPPGAQTGHPASPLGQNVQ
ncbi:hypothetical protein AURDEDRAFT_181775 [Auricularia subglabra TFB-10046 SS5]|nr:hypothetical protein AURDEDRAFT_181775 [Auricularia subglabra TFB-10046 SS5]